MFKEFIPIGIVSAFCAFFLGLSTYAAYQFLIAKGGRKLALSSESKELTG